MKLSIITIVFNRVSTIGHAIESVTRQTYQDIEHLIIDGGSNDGTLAEIEARSHPNMRVISESDEGIYDALNKGMTLATGDAIGLVHSDDFFAHNAVLERVAAQFTDPSIDAVFGDLEYVSASDPSRIIRRWHAGPFEHRKLRRGWMPPHPTVFVRRRVVDAYGDYDTQFRIASDYDAILRWFGNGKINAAYIPEVLVKMRTGGESNGSLGRIFRKSCEDYRALRSNRAGGIATLALKNLRKLPQFLN